MKNMFTIFFLINFSILLLSCQNKSSNKVESNTKISSSIENSITNLSSNNSSNIPSNKKTPDESLIELVKYDGRLKSDGKQSTILYLGKESGDLAGFCFMNDSEAGRLILSKCKVDDLCEFEGKIDWSETECPFGEGMFSAQGRIVSVKSVRRISK